MLVYREVLRLHFELGMSFAMLGEICGISKGCVHNILQRFAATGLSWPLLEDVNEVLLKRLLYPTTAREATEGVDLEYLRTEATRPGMTWQLLWEEYREAHPAGISRSAFYRLGQQMERTKPVMRTDYPGGQYLFVDYSGQRLAFWDRAAEAQVSVEIFVASWGASSHTYVGGSLTQSARDFVASHVEAFAFFGCVPHLITPDNLKAGVTKPDRADPTLSHLYRKCAEHYAVAILPARVAHPRDKATAESAVRCVQQRVLAPLRHQQFFSLAEVNAAIAPLRDALNARPMRDYQGQSRLARFQRDDYPVAKPLPAEPFRVTEAHYGLRVPSNYLVCYDHHYYSVPHMLIDQHVDLFLVGNVLEIYHQGVHVARHAQCPPDNRQSVIDAHQPEAHRRIRGRSKDYYLHVAEAIGPFTHVVVEGIYARRRHDEAAHRTAQGVISLCKQYESSRVEAAAERAVYYRQFTLRDLKQILTQGLDQHPLPGAGQRQLPLVEHAQLRGAAYYQGD
jgi:transposase